MKQLASHWPFESQSWDFFRILANEKNYSTMIDKGGIFSSASVEYVIETQPLKWTVVRKYDDALWLRDQLQRLFPAAIVSCFLTKANQMTNQK